MAEQSINRSAQKRRLLNRTQRHNLLIGVILCIVLFVILMPLYWAISLSFDRAATTALPDFTWLPSEFTLLNYTYAFEQIPLLHYFGNTVMIAVVNTIISVFFALMCGYAFAKGRFFLKKFWYFFMLAVMMIPFESRMIPLYLQYLGWGLINTYWPLILGNVAYVYGIFFATQNISALPDSLRESAFLDGAGEWKIFFSIVIPLSLPVMSALSILQIVAQWNSYLWPMVIIRDSGKQLLSVGISLFNATENGVLYGPRFGAALISAVPLVILFLFLQKYIVQSIAMSGIKQ